MTMEEFTLIARCNGSFTEAFRPDVNEAETDKLILNAVEKATENEREIYDNKFSVIHHDRNNIECKSTFDIKIKYFNLDFFRTAIYASNRRENFYIVASTNRKVLGQTGDGHFSPIAALNYSEDYLLLLDAARFKYNSMWFKVSDVFNSFIPLDATTQKSRGFLLCSRYY
jgi:hypothetical protein